MKKNNLKQLCLVFCFLASKSAFSYDFTAKNADNVTIYYNYINEGKELEVTNNGDYYNTKNSYKGNVKIPETVTINGRERKVTSIGEYAFRYCSGLTSITIPNSVTRIGNEAFVGTGLTSVHISDLAAWCKISFNDNPLSYAHHLFLNGQEIKDLVIPNSVTSIGDFAFYSCSGLTSVTIGNSVTSIGNYAFMNCSGLKSVTIPNSVTSIGSRAFNFTNSNNDVLVEIISLIENPTTETGFGFSTAIYNNATLYVPVGTMAKYKQTQGWKKFIWIEEGIPTGIAPVKQEKIGSSDISSDTAFV